MRLYLTDRYHRVRLGDVISSWKEVGKGFLQGFSFGPPLWNVFQNDLLTKFKNLNSVCIQTDIS